MDGGFHPNPPCSRWHLLMALHFPPPGVSRPLLLRHHLQSRCSTSMNSTHRICKTKHNRRPSSWVNRRMHDWKELERMTYFELSWSIFLPLTNIRRSLLSQQSHIERTVDPLRDPVRMDDRETFRRTETSLEEQVVEQMLQIRIKTTPRCFRR